MLICLSSCPTKEQCYNDVYGVEYDPELDWLTVSDLDWMVDESEFSHASSTGFGDESIGDDSSRINDASFAQ